MNSRLHRGALLLRMRETVISGTFSVVGDSTGAFSRVSLTGWLFQRSDGLESGSYPHKDEGWHVQHIDESEGLKAVSEAVIGGTSVYTNAAERVV